MISEKQRSFLLDACDTIARALERVREAILDQEARFAMAQREVDVLRQRNKTLARQNRYLEGQLEHVQEALKRHLSSRKRQKGYDSTEVDTLRVHVESLKNEI
eukprot:CAMPEP_0184550184 /NCGR_PEP_ID=MMETSP0199_2-20130426/17998_1 /TAXON_ID=1112570 /ORGANISM="Thraustochytrium sp., Strain LLF1b" /LENGTH=102 /DNA_ID=CAMNT_0026945005 /DNA_START=63 /DNA_END=368 /DNA_ORIENTATION=+